MTYAKIMVTALQTIQSGVQHEQNKNIKTDQSGA